MTLELAEVVGQLTALWRFPVEPLAGESLNTTLLSLGGLVGDRFFEIRDAGSGEPLTAAAFPPLLFYASRYLEDLIAGDLERWGRVTTPGGAEYEIADARWLDEISREMGRPLLISSRLPEGRPLRLISRPTLRLAEKIYGAPLEPRRLRANLVIEIQDGKAFDENLWIDRRLRIGEALLEVSKASASCVETSLRPETSAGDASVLESLARAHGGHLGVAARADGLRLRAGDPVVLLD